MSGLAKNKRCQNSGSGARAGAAAPSSWPRRLNSPTQFPNTDQKFFNWNSSPQPPRLSMRPFTPPPRGGGERFTYPSRGAGRGLPGYGGPPNNPSWTARRVALPLNYICFNGVWLFIVSTKAGII